MRFSSCLRTQGGDFRCVVIEQQKEVGKRHAGDKSLQNVLEHYSDNGDGPL